MDETDFFAYPFTLLQAKSWHKSGMSCLVDNLLRNYDRNAMFPFVLLNVAQATFYNINHVTVDGITLSF